jgi:hypothetical protein
MISDQTALRFQIDARPRIGAMSIMQFWPIVIVNTRHHLPIKSMCTGTEGMTSTVNRMTLMVQNFQKGWERGGPHDKMVMRMISPRKQCAQTTYFSRLRATESDVAILPVRYTGPGAGNEPRRWPLQSWR